VAEAVGGQAVSHCVVLGPDVYVSVPYCPLTVPLAFYTHGRPTKALAVEIQPPWRKVLLLILIQWVEIIQNKNFASSQHEI
jgi:hypothetical protein